MRTFSKSLLAAAVAMAAASAVCTAPARAADLAGKWKLVVLPYGDDEFAIVEIKAGEGQAEVVDAQAMLGGPKSAEISAEGGDVTITLAGGDNRFRGKAEGDGPILGTFTFRGPAYPARLEKTDADKVKPIEPSPIRAKIQEASGEQDAAARVEKLAGLLDEAKGHPVASVIYQGILGSAADASLKPEEVRKYVDRWASEAAPYGPEWSNQIRTRALQAVSGKEAYADVAVALALAAEEALGDDATTEARAQVAGLLARSARLAGRAEVAGRAEARSKELEDKLDAEYHEKVPPFKPEPYAGREGQGDRVAVMEIFTGAECPPCVGADVGFDALLKTYKPTEFIGLQYHLHIPGPDPLTSPAALKRQEYYSNEIQGTPSTFFNGKRDGGSGGFMQHAEQKYGEYQAVIRPILAEAKKAEIEVAATRAEDTIKVSGRASAKGAGDAKPRLRLALVEPEVRYPGGNQLRFHHNVVRGFVGGAEGQALEGGEGKVEATLDLAELRKELESYLEEYPRGPRGRAFPKPLPPIELDELAVVAFVQDDADRSIWHAVQVPVTVANP